MYQGAKAKCNTQVWGGGAIWVFIPALPLPRGPRATHLTYHTHLLSVLVYTME